jgi:glycerol-3-phosphate cytidylyltransferase
MFQWNRGLICGSFDVIHPGYIHLFKDAKSVCKKLVIALQSDPTVDRPEKIKPSQTIEDRELILRSIKYIDDVVHYTTESELYNLLKTDIYDVRILGTDYMNKDYTGKDLNKPEYFHSRNHGYSTTQFKKNIKENMK